VTQARPVLATTADILKGGADEPEPTAAAHRPRAELLHKRLTRNKIAGGKLERRICGEGLREVTSDPAIFFKAIGGSRDYDEQIERAFRAGRSASEAHEELVVTDVRDACDVLRPVYEQIPTAGTALSVSRLPWRRSAWSKHRPGSRRGASDTSSQRPGKPRAVSKSATSLQPKWPPGMLMATP
jgi:Transaldolase/Fructose-6-phosphate aldolase